MMMMLMIFNTKILLRRRWRIRFFLRLVYFGYKRFSAFQAG